LNLYVHCPGYGACNCYIIGTGNSALIIDPGKIDKHIIKLIEDNEFVLRGVLFTHGHRNHINGITTLRRIYNTEIYCIKPAVLDYRTVPVRDGEILNIGGFRVEVINVPGHSADSAVFKIDQLLFTGDALTAGLVGSTASVYGTSNQMSALRNKILSLPGYYTILPGHGPPSSLEAERRFNAGVNTYRDNRSRRPDFILELEENSKNPDWL
jgi:glyoxylase-like metal-dependent hydrolase (beta-lactamase superfamily II)